MYCPKCGQQIDDPQTVFCTKCSNNLQGITGNKPASTFCRNCGKELIGRPDICMNCGAKPSSGNSFCPVCGSATNALAVICVKCGAGLELKSPTVIEVKTNKTANISSKSRLVLLLFVIFLGEFGAHRFYAGKIGTAIIMLILGIIGFATIIVYVGFFFLGIVGVWGLVDFIMILAGSFKDKDGKIIKNWTKLDESIS